MTMGFCLLSNNNGSMNVAQLLSLNFEQALKLSINAFFQSNPPASVKVDER